MTLHYLLPIPALHCCLLCCTPAHANNLPGDPVSRSESPYFQVLSPVPDGVDALPLKDTQVDVTIAGVIAEVAVTQTYAHEGTAPIEARYVFPGSTRAAVHGLTMVIGDRVVRAVIQRKEEARHTYEAAKTAGKTASLLEQHRPNVFGMNLANILPGDVIRVELRYTELLVPQEGEYQFVYPTVVGPRYVQDRRSLTDVSPALPEAGRSEPWTATAHLSPGEEPQSTFGLSLALRTGVPIVHLACSTHPVRISSPAPHQARVALDPAADPVKHANRDVIISYRLAGDAVHAGLIASRSASGQGGYFLAMIQPPARVEPAMIPARDYVFVVDVSGSMNGFPLDTSKQLLAELIAALRPTDTFNIVLFAGAAARLSPEPLPATPENLARAIVLLDREQGGGGTNLLPALQASLALPRPATPLARTFVIVTDGYITVEAEAFKVVRSHLDRANVFAFGIGSSVNRHLIEGLARAGQGEAFIVTEPGRAAEAASRFRAYIESPLLTGVQATGEGIELAGMTPAVIPDLFAGRPIVLTGTWSGPLRGQLTVAGTAGFGAYSATLEFAQATVLENSRALELLWARAHIQSLADDETGGSDVERVSAITALGLRHGLLTEHTSFVAVDEIVRHAGGASPTVNQAVPLPAGVSATALSGQTVATTPEPASVALVAVAVGALLAAWWTLRRSPIRHAH